MKVRRFLATVLLAAGVIALSTTQPAELSAQPLELSIKKTRYTCSLEGELTKENLKLSREDGKKLFKKGVISAEEIEELFEKAKKQLKKLKQRAKSGSVSPNKLKKLKSRNKQLKQLTKLMETCWEDFEDQNPGGGFCSSTDFSRVTTVLNTHCMSCHQLPSMSPVGAFQAGNAEWFIANNLVTPGDHTRSELYLRLRGNPENIGPQNMPNNESTLSQSDISAIRCWINSLEAEDPEEPFSFSCNPEADPAPMPLMRLSRVQYENAVLDLLSPLASQNSDYLTVREALQNEFRTLPEDEVPKVFLEERDFPNHDNLFRQTLLDGIYRTATVFGSQINSALNRRLAYASCDLANASAPNSCKESFISTFGAQVFRRPLSTDERTRFLAFLNSRPAESRLAETFALFLLQPQFLFHVETQGTPVSGKSKLYRLSPYEQASRLAFALWQAPPDETLMEFAANGAFETSEGYEDVVNILFESYPQGRTRNMIHDFWWNHLELDSIPPIDANNSPAFDTFQGNLNIPTGGEDLLVAMKQEILDITNYHTFEQPGNFHDLMQSTISTTTNPTLAAIYGVSPRVENGPVRALPAPRSLIERAVMLVSGRWSNLPISRGGGFYREWLCNPLSPPPPEAEGAAMIPEPDPEASTRQTYTNLTAQPLCMTCHSKINPLGFALEAYDALGRRRTVERIFGEGGAVLASHPIDAAVTAQFLSGVTAEVNGPTELLASALETGKMDACLSQQYFRFVFRRREDLLQDGCSLEQMRQSLTEENGTLADFFKQVVLTPIFRLKKVGP